MTEQPDELNKTPKSNEGRAPKIVITLDDLPPEETAFAPREFPGMPYPAKGVNIAAGKKGVLAGLGGSAVKQNLLAGLLGGIFACVLSEVFFQHGASVTGSVLADMGLWGAAVSASIGGALGCAEGVTGQVKEKALLGGAVGAAVGLAGGFCGGIFGQLIYSLLGGGARVNSWAEQVLARTLGWALLGMCMGVAQGASGKAWKKVVNGLLGGLLGGAIGGLAFDFLANIFQTGVLSRLFGVTILGGLTGAGIGLVEEARKEAWLKVLEGPQSGKQFIIYAAVTRIGSSPQCEIVLIKDPLVQAEHCRIAGRANSYYLECRPGADVLVNGAPAVGSSRLKRGITMRVGKSLLMYEDKEATRAMGGGLFK